MNSENLLIFPIKINDKNKNELYIIIDNNLLIPSIKDNIIDYEKINSVLTIMFFNNLNYKNYFFYINNNYINKDKLSKTLFTYSKRLTIIDDELLYNI